MRKVLSLLLIAIIIFSFCACATDNTIEENSQSTNESQVLTEYEAEKIAKDKIEELCCDWSGVSKISIDYGEIECTENYDGYLFETKGTYYPIDGYGRYEDRKIFDIHVEVSEYGIAYEVAKFIAND